MSNDAEEEGDGAAQCNGVGHCTNVFGYILYCPVSSLGTSHSVSACFWDDKTLFFTSQLHSRNFQDLVGCMHESVQNFF